MFRKIFQNYSKVATNWILEWEITFSGRTGNTLSLMYWSNCIILSNNTKKLHLHKCFSKLAGFEELHLILRTTVSKYFWKYCFCVKFPLGYETFKFKSNSKMLSFYWKSVNSNAPKWSTVVPVNVVTMSVTYTYTA